MSPEVRASRPEERRRLRLRSLLAAGVVLATLGGTNAFAQAPGARTAAPTAQSDEDDGAPGPVDPNGPNPHGDAPPSRGGSPHGQGAQGAQGARGGQNGMFEAPEDASIEDPTLPPGTIAIHIADPMGNPIANTDVTLGVLFNSVAKGESRKRLAGVTDAKGELRFDKLDTGSEAAYRVSVAKDGGSFAIMPFRLPAKTGMRALLHVYPIVRDIAQSLVVSQAIFFAEVKDDRIQIQQAYRIYNFGKTAWVPNDLVVPLPENFTAFSSQQGMSDVGVDAVPKKGVRVHGTFGPGQHVIEFRWQIPYSGEAEVHLDVGLPPHMAAARVIAPASKTMTLEVPGFPPPQSTSDQMGQRTLITEKQVRREDPALSTLAVTIKGLPTEGPAKFIATLMALGGLVLGLVLGTQKPVTRDRKAERSRLLEDLENLERAHAAGDVGPKTYEKARRDLIDAIARTFADPAPSKKRKRA